MLSHYHKFHFFINVTDIEVSYAALLNNVIFLELKGNNSVLHQGIENLKNNYMQIGNLIQKFKNKRMRRALINALGTAIKYITGNPDNNDLNEIIKQTKHYG